MAKDYSFTIEGHPSIYKPQARKLKIYFCEPENGVNKETGILLMIPGFGGNANSNVYKKMRAKFSDKYNLITVQCDYFGWEFMQEANKITFNMSKSELEFVFNDKEMNEIFEQGNLNFHKLLQLGSKYNISISCRAKMDEDLTCFNDMGIMQAMDNVEAILAIIEVLRENGLRFNQGKIMAYGNSHGAYLAYLSNALAPNLFSLIIDNSSWLYPSYLTNNRLLSKKIGNAVLVTTFDYLGKNVFTNKELLSLPILYKKFKNNCKIISYHGTTDNLISHYEKRNFCLGIDNCSYIEISNRELDGKIFKSTNHGLDADFLELFDYTFINDSINFNCEKDIKHSVIEYESDRYNLFINYENTLPTVVLEEKHAN